MTLVADPGHRLAARYSVGITPYLVGVDGEGVVRTRGLVNDRLGLEAATHEILDTPADANRSLTDEVKVA